MYGEQSVAHVTERTPCLPKSEKARWRVRAERQWHSLAMLHPAAVLLTLRLPGIYGPDRSALHTLASGHFRPSQTDQFPVSRIHVDDIISTLLAIIQLPPSSNGPSEVFPTHREIVLNVADDAPASRIQVFSFARHLLSRCSCPIISPDALSPQSLAESPRSKHRTCKHVDNLQLKRLLVPHLHFPSYISGLTTIAVEQFGLEVGGE